MKKPASRPVREIGHGRRGVHQRRPEAFRFVFRSRGIRRLACLQFVLHPPVAWVFSIETLGIQRIDDNLCVQRVMHDLIDFALQRARQESRRGQYQQPLARLACQILHDSSNRLQRVLR